MGCSKFKPRSANENGDISLDYTGIPSGIQLGLFISSENHDSMLQKNSNARVITNQGNVEVNLPLSVLPDNQHLEFSILKDSKVFENSLTPVFDFTIQSIEDGTFIKDFKDHPVLLTFTVDPSKVKNWDDVKVRYINDAGVLQDEVIKILSIDKTTGKVVAEVMHFSKYGVFEVASATNNNSTGNTSTNTTGTTTTGSTPTTTTGTTSTTTAGSNSSTNTLPDTATDMYNLFLVGLTVLALGGIMLFIRNKR